MIGRRDAMLGLFIGQATGAWAMQAQALDASEQLLPTTDDLQQSLAFATRQGQPLVVLATLHGCPFCKVARENYLFPASKEGAVVTQIHFLSRMPLRDCAGRATSHGQVVKDLGIGVAPTVLFYGRGGKELAPRLTAGSTSDFYGAYLDERLAQARASFQSTN
ncbi:hypothetical protein HNP33_003891 [Comamonas odontotermitis]|uniref:Thioredoxin-like fold domain-containing protein n=1 Tax=Comamonas odontotermitis TaxID=379895 RepID=A0ABR6RKR3_9BURK|nr:hypothetical protein [Comamonas odontotermitis]MBB6579775.1 hypothetical protein [Comamonas odontotermitis]